MDVFTRRKRSEIMSRVRSKGTVAELSLRRAIHRRGLRYGIDAVDLPGRPDIVFRTGKVAVFVHGCFWHSHACARGARPSTNRTFWEAKLDRNKRRDRSVLRQVKAIGWKAVVVWECDINNSRQLGVIADQIVKLVKMRRLGFG